MSQQLFGTDGIRGRPGEEPLTPQTLTALGRILADLLAAEPSGDGEAAVLVGHDGRESGESLGAALADGLVKGGCQVDVLGLAPTPTVAYLTQAGPYRAGVVISASHNPAADNGIKLLGGDGSKLPDATEREIETRLAAGRELKDAARPGALRRTKGQVGDYLSWLRSEAFPDLDLQGWRIVMDCANGAYSQLGPRILKAFGAEAVPIHHQPDGRNINAGCGALHPETAAAAVLREEARLGLAVDGDGDRGMLVDSRGRILDGDVLLAGLGAHFHSRGRLRGDAVVATVMSNMGLERFLARQGVQVEREAVGDRNVMAAMRARDRSLGGEKSGHLLFGPEHAFRGDGVYTLLKTAEAMLESGMEPAEFAREYSEMPQKLLNLSVSRREPMDKLPHLSESVRETDAALAGRGRTVVRFSGTELLLRLMVEAEDHATVDAALERLRAAALQDGILA